MKTVVLVSLGKEVYVFSDDDYANKFIAILHINGFAKLDCTITKHYIHNSAMTAICDFFEKDESRLEDTKQ